MFPLVTSLLPLALFADASDKLLLVYMILTDFLSVLPVAIKGVEMLQAASTVSISTETLVRGDIRNRGSTVVARTFSGRCELARKPTAVGASFLSLAIFVMLGGVALEFIVKAEVEKNKRAAEKRRMFSVEWDEHLWARKYLCGNCNCHRQPREPHVTGGLIGQLMQQRKEAKADSVLRLDKER